MSETRRQPGGCRFTIVIPALNEEDAIGGTIERCLAVRERICRETGVTGVDIVVVSDGSTDRTVEIAGSYDDVDVLVFPENRGYGAAIKAGWERGGGDLLGFLDADGTCDPEYFIPMCREVLDGGKDVLLGCRMGSDSKMPRIRRIGNTMFAILLGFLSKQSVRDTASGMRVIRKESLPKLLPLPDGLHFTPAMSAVALMDQEVKIAEIDMRYEERIGRSKLHVLKDGVLFLAVILSAAAYIRVSRLTVPIMAALFVFASAIMIGPTRFYLANRSLEEWMFYRFALSQMLGTVIVTLLCATIVVEHVVALTLMRYEQFRARSRGLWRYETLRKLVVLGIGLWVVGAALNVGGVKQLLTSGQVTIHWSRVVVGAFISVNLAQLAGAFFSLKIIRALHQRQPFLHPAAADE